jgi:hypothetical protein
MESGQGQSVVHREAEQATQQDGKGKGITFEGSEAYRMTMTLSKKAYVDILQKRDLLAIQFGAELVTGIWDKRIKAEDVKNPCKNSLNTNSIPVLDTKSKRSWVIKKRLSALAREKRPWSITSIFRCSRERRE